MILPTTASYHSGSQVEALLHWQADLENRIENLERVCVETLKIVKNLNHSSNYIFEP